MHRGAPLAKPPNRKESPNGDFPFLVARLEGGGSITRAGLEECATAVRVDFSADPDKAFAAPERAVMHAMGRMATHGAVGLMVVCCLGHTKWALACL